VKFACAGCTRVVVGEFPAYRGRDGEFCATCIPAVTIPPPVASAQVSESLIDSLLGDVAGYLVALREPCYGGVPVTDDMAKERAAAIVQGLIMQYRITPLDGGRA
jgi:hypothetical protein